MGVTDSFDSIFRRYYQQLYAFALRYVGSEDDCHDIVTAVYEDVWLHFSNIDETTIRQYLYTNVRNRCIDHLRRQQCHQRYIKAAAILSQHYIDEQQYLEQEERLKTALQAINALKSPTREILEACYLHGKKYKEVAQDMGISIATVKKHMVRALKILRDIKKSMKT